MQSPPTFYVELMSQERPHWRRTPTNHATRLQARLYAETLIGRATERGIVAQVKQTESSALPEVWFNGGWISR